MGRLVIHVGLPKCASTTIQRAVLPALEEVLHLRAPAYYEALTLAHFPAGEAARKSVLSEMRERAQAAPGLAVFSCEHLSMPANWLETRAHVPGRERKLGRDEITALMAEHLPEAHILLVIRRQADWLASWHQERVKRTETRPLARLIAAPEMAAVIESLEYGRLVGHYQEHLGPERVSLLPLELLRRAPEAFMARLFSVLGVQERPIVPQRKNARLSPLSVAARRQLNKGLRALSRLSGHRAGVDHRMHRFVKRVFAYDFLISRLVPMRPRPVTLPAALRESYARDNARLDALLGLGLEGLGYVIAREPETAPKNIEKAGRIANRPDSLGETP